MNMLTYGTERFVVYAPRYCRFNYGRLRTIVSAAKRAAQDLGISIDGVLRRNTLSVTVYYENAGKENWVYSDWERNFNEDKIYDIIRGLIFALNHVHRLNEVEVLSNG